MTSGFHEGIQPTSDSFWQVLWLPHFFRENLHAASILGEYCANCQPQRAVGDQLTKAMMMASTHTCIKKFLDRVFILCDTTGNNRERLRIKSEDKALVPIMAILEGCHYHIIGRHAQESIERQRCCPFFCTFSAATATSISSKRWSILAMVMANDSQWQRRRIY